MKQPTTILQLNSNKRMIDIDEVNEANDRSAAEILKMDGLNRNKNKLPPIERSNSGNQEQLMIQYNNQQQLITPKHEQITERLQTFGQTEQFPMKTKSFKKLIIYFHQKDFIKMLLDPYKLTQAFTQKHFQLINDLSSSFKQQIGRNSDNQKSLIQQYIQLIDFRIQVRLKFRTLKTQCKQYLNYIHNQIPLIEPMSNAILFWDLICFGIRIYLIVVIPVLLAFHGQNFIDVQQAPLVIFSFLLIADIILRAFTITYDQGLPVRDRKILLKKQLNFGTILECFSFIFTIIIALDQNDIIDENILEKGWPKFILILQYMQIFNILKFIDTSQYSFKLSRMSTSILELIKLVTLILLVQHVFSCVWIIFGIQSIQDQKESWLQKYNYDNWQYQFLQSFYFICVTTFTVGYGDITPKNPAEQIFTIIYMFFCMLLFSYTVNTIGSILTQIKESSDKIKMKLTAINQYMQNKQISAALQFKVREQLYFYLKQEVIQQVNEQSEILQLLPEDLQHSLRIEAAKSLINKCQFFDNFSQEVVNLLLEEVDFTSYQPGATIQSKDELYIHIIEQGQVEVLYKKKMIQTLERYDYFGVEEFVTQQMNSNIVYKSTAFTSVLSIPYSYFHKILSQNDLENQKFLNLLTQSNFAPTFCYICKKTSHSTQKCKLVHFIPNQEVVLKRYLYRKKQKKRVKFQRKDRNLSVNEIEYFDGQNKVKQINFKNTCLNQKMVEQTVKKFKMDNEVALELLFPTIEQPLTIDSQSESDNNDDIDDIKDQSFSCNRENSRRESKQALVPSHSSQQLVYHQLEKMKKERITKQIQPLTPQQNVPPQYQNSQYLNSPTPQIATKQQLKKLFQSKFGKQESLLDEQYNSIKLLNFFDEIRVKMNNLLFQKKEQEQIEFWYKKLINQREEIPELLNFDLMKNYEIFNRQWNVDIVIKRIVNKPRKFRGFKKLKRFLLYPFIYLSKYLDKRDPNDPTKQTEKTKKKRPTRPKVQKKSRVSPQT